MPNFPYEEKVNQEAQEEQRFINAWADTRTAQLQNLFPVTSKTVETKDAQGNVTSRTHESLSTCEHKHLKAKRWIPFMREQEVDRTIPDTDWDKDLKQWVPNGTFRTIRTIESTEDGKEREWECRDCSFLIPEHCLTAVYPNVKFDKPEIDL